MKYILMIAAVITVSIVHAQNLKPEQVKQMLDAKNYSFEALTAMPQAGSTRQLTPGFSLKVSGDSLISYLPYFGRAYSAPMNTSDAGYTFTSTKFDYTIVPGKKNSYRITIKINDKIPNAIFLLTVFDNGWADVQATSNDKQPISFHGYIK